VSFVFARLLIDIYDSPNTPGILSIISNRVPPSLKGIVVSITIGTWFTSGAILIGWILKLCLRVGSGWGNSGAVTFRYRCWKG
jgi:hypothetical protein